MAVNFSNQMKASPPALWLYRTQQSYVGQNGYSLRMEGLEPGFNDNALTGDTIHGAPYVSPVLARVNGSNREAWAARPYGRRLRTSRIDSMKDGQLLFSYYPDQCWLKKSSYINCGSGTVATASKSTTNR